MNITEENLSKLKQLDRIEFRQKYEKLEKEQFEIGYFEFSKYMMIGIILVASLGTFLILLGHKEVAESFLPLIRQLLLITVIGVLVLGAIGAFFQIKYKKEKDKLKEEYFKIEGNK